MKIEFPLKCLLMKFCRRKWRPRSKSSVAIISKEVALLIGTSGSTCLPRVAELSHLSSRTLLHPAYTTTLLNRIAMCTSSVRWISYFILLLTGLRSNCTRIIVDDEKDGKFHCDVIKKYKVDDNTEISW